MTPQVYLIVLNWNRRDDTLRCLGSLLAMDYADFHVLLVDNASTDDTVEAVRAAFPQVEILVNPENLGFSGGMNRGLEVALARQVPYVLLLNNDIVVEPDMLARLVRTAQSDERIGVVSPLIYYPGRRRVWFAGGYRRRFWPGRSLPGHGLRDRARYHRRREVDYATGCAMLVRTEVLRQVGLFEAKHFMYHEDFDLSERICRAGWRIVLEPAAQMEHYASISTGGEYSPEKWFYLARYLVPFYRRYYRWPRLSLALYTVWVVVRELLKGNARVIPPYLRGTVVGWREQFADKGVT